MPIAKPKILIVGGGIAGPACALFLQRLGVKVEVCEAYPARALSGAALGIAPNGMAMMDRLGLADHMLAAGSPVERFVMRAGSGRKLGEMAYAPPDRYRFPGVSINRATLYAILFDALEARGVPVSFGKRLVDLVQDEDGVTARFEHGDERRCDLVIGADGLRSAVRRLAMPEAPAPAFTGLIGSGGFVPRRLMQQVLGPDGQTSMTFCFGPGGFVGYALGDRTEKNGGYWWNAVARDHPVTDDERPALAGAAGAKAFLDANPDFGPAIRTLIEGTTTHLGPLDLYDVQALPRWSAGRVMLIGDAAHAVSPHSGQGASMALEDGLVLAKALATHRFDHGAAFAAFEAERRPRTDKVIAMGRRSGDLKRRGPVGKALQSLLMPLLLKIAPANRWLYGYDPTPS